MSNNQSKLLNEIFYLSYTSALRMKLTCNDFKYEKLIKGNCKILSTYIFLGSIYEIFFLLYIFFV